MYELIALSDSCEDRRLAALYQSVFVLITDVHWLSDVDDIHLKASSTTLFDNKVVVARPYDSRYQLLDKNVFESNVLKKKKSSTAPPGVETLCLHVTPS